MASARSTASRLRAGMVAAALVAASLPAPVDARQAGAADGSRRVGATVAGRLHGTSVVTGAAASIVGSAWNADNTAIPRAHVRLRNLVSGEIAAATTADESGQFTFADTPAGTYVVELISEAGKVLTIGQPLTVTPGETVATFVRLGSRAPWFSGFFGNAALAVATAAAATGLTALAPEQMQPVSGRR